MPRPILPSLSLPCLALPRSSNADESPSAPVAAGPMRKPRASNSAASRNSPRINGVRRWRGSRPARRNAASRAAITSVRRRFHGSLSDIARGQSRAAAETRKIFRSSNGANLPLCRRQILAASLTEKDAKYPPTKSRKHEGVTSLRRQQRPRSRSTDSHIQERGRHVEIFLSNNLFKIWHRHTHGIVHALHHHHSEINFTGQKVDSDLFNFWCKRDRSTCIEINILKKVLMLTTIWQTNSFTQVVIQSERGVELYRFREPVNIRENINGSTIEYNFSIAAVEFGRSFELK